MSDFFSTQGEWDDEAAKSSAVITTKATAPTRVIEPDDMQALTYQHAEGALYFDIETIPSEEGCCPAKPVPLEVSPNLPGEGVLNGTLKDVEVLLANVIGTAEWRSKLLIAEELGKNRTGAKKAIQAVPVVEEQYQQAIEDWCKKASTTPEYLKIIGFGWRVGNGEIFSMVDGSDGDTEIDILRCFWNLAALHRPLIGYNCRSFDIPAILIRSAFCGVTDCCFPIDRRKYGNREMLDLFELRFDGTAADCGTGKRSMKEWAAMCGIVPKSDLHGGLVYDTYRSDPDKIHEYVQSDIYVVSRLHKRFQNLLW